MATVNPDMKPLVPGVKTQPYKHATRLFIDDNMKLAPKQKFLYYVCINIDTTAITAGSILESLLGTSDTTTLSLVEQYEAGLLVKRTDLPKFTINTKTLQSYNRKHIIQTGISYEPITMSFHDDAANTVHRFWNDYYTYYYRDSDYNSVAYQQSHINDGPYNLRSQQNWGFNPRNASIKPFIRNIQIFSLHNKRFTEYLLINPYITSWRHGEHDSSAGNEVMENQMTIAYETVKYRTGYVNPVDVNGFALLHYDTDASPITTSTTNVYTDDGLLGALQGSSKDLARPDGQGGSNVIGAILNAYNAYKSFSKSNLSQLATLTIGQIGNQLLNNTVNSLAGAVFPGVGGTSMTYGNGAYITGGGLTGAITAGGVALGSTIVNRIGGAILTGTDRAINNGVTKIGNSVNAAWDRATATTTNPSGISVDDQGQPVSIQRVVYNNGEIVDVEIVQATSNGGAIPGDPLQNAKTVNEYVDSDGATITKYTYQDGSQVIKSTDPSYNALYIDKNGNSQTYTSYAETYRDTPQPAAPDSYSGGNYVRDPKTGMVYVSGGSTQAQIVNGLSGTLGALSGAYIGSSVSNLKIFGDSKIGQIANNLAGTAAGAITTKLVNNALNPIIDKIAGGFNQGYDNLIGSITNKIDSWFQPDVNSLFWDGSDYGVGSTIEYAAGSVFGDSNYA